MRLLIAIALLSMTTPVFAQTVGTSSGASSVLNMNMSDPPSNENRLITTPTIAAPGLTAAGIETCLGSASGGVSVMGGGFTFGSTTVDQGCTIRLLARQLFAFGFRQAAMAVMCEDAHVGAAMAAVGTPCQHFFVEIGGSAEAADQVFAVPVADRAPRVPGAEQAFDTPADLVRQNGIN